MAVITPNTNIRLLKLPIELSSTNQITFTSEQNQEYYFTHLDNYLLLENATYQRKDGTLRFNECYDEVIKYNYCMYQNESYSNKWFYAFIEDVQWLSNESCAIKLKTDVFQTWMFDIVYLPSFVEREHVTDDTVGKHTVPEGLETGEFICNEYPIIPTFQDLLDVNYILSSTTHYTLITGEDKPSSTGGSIYNGIYSGTTYFTFESADTIKGIVNMYASHGQVDTINGIFIAPKVLSPLGTDTERAERIVAPSTTPYVAYLNTDKWGTLNGYTPRNKKLLISDYNYLLASNNNGSDIVYKYELFDDENCNFEVVGAITPGCSIKLIPIGYNGIDENTDEGLTLGKYPICSFQTDMYTNWLTQNSINIGGIKITQDALNLGASALQTMGGIALLSSGAGSLAGAGMVASGLSSITSSLIQQKNHSYIPTGVQGNLNSGDVIFSRGLNTFSLYKMTIKEEYARIIDKYMDAYGYKINLIKIPNINGRSNWNYVKTIGCNLHGYIPTEDLNELKNMFDAGITLWHHTTTFLDYSQTNSIV